VPGAFALGPCPPSGPADQYISITQRAEGKIIFDRVRADILGLLAQIGAMRNCAIMTALFWSYSSVGSFASI
jgi:hypothetical protein